MDLAKTQLLLVQLYTDAALRERFFSDPEAAGREFGLDRQQAREFAKLSACQVNFFADSLIRKRLGEVRRLLPLTRKALGARFEVLFRRYAEIHRLEMPKPHQNDAISFTAFLEHSARTEFSKMPWGLDAARFEAACLAAIAAGRRWIVRLFRYPIQELLRSVAGPDQAPPPRPRPTLAIWLRFSRSGQLRSFVLSPPTLSLARRKRMRGSDKSSGLR